MANAGDPFADAKTNIRDTVKWLAATFAALAAVVIGGSPVSGLGKLPLRELAFWLAVACLMAAFVCICAALRVTLGILRPEAIYRSDLYGRGPKWRSASDCRELQRIRALIDGHAKDLLPYNYRTLDKLGRRLDACTRILRMKHAEPATKNSARTMAADINKVFGQLLFLAQYLRLQMRLHAALPMLMWLGIAALVSLSTFGVVIASASKAQQMGPESINEVTPLHSAEASGQ